MGSGYIQTNFEKSGLAWSMTAVGDALEAPDEHVRPYRPLPVQTVTLKMTGTLK